MTGAKITSILPNGEIEMLFTQGNKKYTAKTTAGELKRMAEMAGNDVFTEPKKSTSPKPLKKSLLVFFPLHKAA